MYYRNPIIFSYFYSMITILGPTASGKTNLAVKIASLVNGEIISADSRQVYRGMDIGSGKDISEYTLGGVKIPYHLIDICDAGEEYNVFRFQQDALKAINKMKQNDQIPILCGGTGMYIDSILQGYEMQEVPLNGALRLSLEDKSDAFLVEKLGRLKQLHNNTDVKDKERLIRAIEIAEFQAVNPPNKMPELNNITFGINFQRNELKDRITNRLLERLENGMIEEVQGLLDSGVTPEQLKFYGLEYKLLTQHLVDDMPYNDMFQKLNSAIHQFAKRQMTWFRRMERNGQRIFWLDGNLDQEQKVNQMFKIYSQFTV